MPRRRRQAGHGLLAACALALTVLAGPGAAQDPSAPPQTVTPLAVIDQERLFRDSRFGARVQQEIAEFAAELEEENEALLVDLVAREAELTQLRPTLPPDEFRRLANTFDREVEEIRRTQELKSRQVGQMQDQFRQMFFEQALPLLPGLMREVGAQVLVDARSVVIALEAADLTSAAIDAIDRELGDGGDALPQLPQPDVQLPPADEIPQLPQPDMEGGGNGTELTLP